MENKRNIFEPLKLEVKDIKNTFIIHRKHLTIRMMEAISYCIKHDKPKITFAEIKTSGTEDILLLNVSDTDFLGNLNMNFSSLIEWEEYELCADIIKVKEKISHMMPRKNKEKDKKSNNLISTIRNL